MTIDQYIQNINAAYQRGNATEHTYRGDLKQLIESLVVDIVVTNEPSRQSCGAPDYILTKKDIPVGFIEAKDIGDKDLEGAKKIGNKEQFDRYKASLHNLIFTDYLDFYLYRAGQFVLKIAIGEITPKGIKPIHANFCAFTDMIKDFCSYIGQTITSSKKLAEMMAGKARLLSVIIEKALTSDESNNEDSTLKDQMIAFREILIHDITPKGFADVYAQTIAYGMFAARTHDKTIDTFSRNEAAELIPKSNPFLRRLFGYIAGPDIDDRIKWIVDSLAEIFLACNVMELLKDYGKATKMEDPIIHFYETFLSEYDPALRKARGVWYTPQPVVNFIVRAVDDILKTEFDLPNGLADTSKTKIKVQDVGKATADLRSKTEPIEREVEVHKVQILDPATGTGTFLAEVIKLIHDKFKDQQGIWSNYVETHLLPRLNGFELLMASYAMAHLKLDLLLTETGYKPTSDQRFRVYLTNSLEENHPDTNSLHFAKWLSSEANEANQVKRDTPVMCVIGNPPYSVSSTNKGEWIEKLTADYKKDLNERNIQPLSDDYIKFIRYGQHFIDKNGSGVLAYISNNSFIDGIIHRQMRKNLLESFDKIYILDLHGSAKKKEVCSDGTVDQNVFDIMQGVSINLFVKTGKKMNNELGQIFQFDLFGKREFKYDFLNQNSLRNIEWNTLEYNIPNYFFTHKNFISKDDYLKGFKLDELFVIQSLGIEFGSKEYFLDDSKSKIIDFIKGVIINPLVTDQEIESKYEIKTTSGWKFGNLRRKETLSGFQNKRIKKCINAPFDIKYTYHSDILRRPQIEVLQHLHQDNIALITLRQSRAINSFCYFLADNVYSKDVISILDRATGFPLYLYPEPSAQQTIEPAATRSPNLNAEIVKQIAEGLGLEFVAEKDTKDLTGFENRSGLATSFAPIDLLDYIYAVLHSPTYREKYKEFLKIDFPRVPYPKDRDTFWQLVKLGGELRQIHLLESLVVNRYITQYPVDGDNMVGRIKYQNGKVFINDAQYFDNVPEVAWNFYIGGYQPAQKWLKDRKNRKLEFDDILHYQKIVVALTETGRIMKEIDKIEI
ncbi:MAG: N-6 DNA methylase [Bacteroidia bacterium]|nr:N-6 DNA methylase [Bacteroidia bacterium]